VSSSAPPLDVGLVVIGGYTADRDGHAVGVTALTLQTSPDGQVRATTVGSVALSSPSFVIKHPEGPWLFAVTEGNPGQVASLALADDGSLSLLDARDTTGSVGNCHLALTTDGGHLVAVGYGSGTTSSFAVGPAARLSEQLDLLTFAGSGPDPDRQRTPHAHQVVPDGSELLVCDLGSDQIHRLRVDHVGHLSRSAPPITLPEGTGPRHLVLVEDHLVVVCELSAELWVGRRRGAGGWQQVDRVPSTGVRGEQCAPSAIVNRGTRVYVANRGPGTVAVFDLDPEQGELVRVAEFPGGGDWPRDLALSDGRLWVANQHNDVVSVFSTSELPPERVEFEFWAPSPTSLVLLAGSG
jgi:6-phosphogluconolactonase (cycloisomerase 2 family)